MLDSRLTAGVDFRRIQGEGDQDVFNTPGVLAAKVIGEGDQTSVGAFGELSVTPLRGLELLGNLRLGAETSGSSTAGGSCPGSSTASTTR